MSTYEKKAIFWFAVDWGTSHWRFWIINREDGKLINEKSIPLGIKFINHKNFENILVNEFQDY